MDWNWVTAALIGVVVWSIWLGARRGLAWESGNVIGQLASLAAGGAALWLAWLGSRRLAQLAQSADPRQLPDWVSQVVQAWQRTPQVAQALVFILVYLLASGCLNHLLRYLPASIVRWMPPRIGRNRWLGAALGAVVGGVRATVYGGLLFLLLQYMSLPALATEAAASGLYQALQRNVYEPWLAPVAARELPVLTKEALDPLTKNISLFALPTGTRGQEQGILIVPQPIADLARHLTAHDRTARDKARTLYEWEIHHIRYDWNKYDDFVYRHQWDEQSPLQTLQTGKGVCADFALLYADMAHAVGLKVQIDEGMGGTGENLGPHAWNQVWDPAANRWIPVDTTWGSQEDVWFDNPHFGATHFVQTAITIAASLSR